MGSPLSWVACGSSSQVQTNVICHGKFQKVGGYLSKCDCSNITYPVVYNLICVTHFHKTKSQV